MKVVCVDDKNRTERLRSSLHNGITNAPNGRPVKGETYTAIGEAVVPDGFGNSGTLRLCIEEKPHIYEGKDYGWASDRFVPLSYFEAEFAVSTDLEVPTPNPHPLPLGLIRESSGFQRQLSF